MCFATCLVLAQGVSLPYTSGFDSAIEKAGWQQYRTGFASLSNWTYSNFQPFSAPTCLSHDYNVGGSQADTVIDWFVSPPLNITALTKLSLKVSAGGFSSAIPDNLGVWYGTDKQNPTNGNFTLIGNLSYIQANDQWIDTNLMLTLVSDSGYIALRYKTIGAAWWTPKVDNIDVRLNSGASIVENLNPERGMVTVFPNPFKTKTMVFVDDKLLDLGVEIKMYDIFGREIRKMSNVRKNENIITRDNLINGIYFIKVMIGETVIDTKKLIVE